MQRDMHTLRSDKRDGIWSGTGSIWSEARQEGRREGTTTVKKKVWGRGRKRKGNEKEGRGGRITSGGLEGGVVTSAIVSMLERRSFYAQVGRGGEGRCRMKNEGGRRGVRERGLVYRMKGGRERERECSVQNEEWWL